MKARIASILSALDRIPSSRVTVFGDFCLDKYLLIDPDRDEPSVETGLTAYQVVGTRKYPGGAGAVVNNLRALGAQVRCVGLLGDDGEGYELLQALRATGADTEYMVQSTELCTSTYTKPMRRQPDGSYQEMNRLDMRNFSRLSPAVEDRLIQSLNNALRDTQGIVIIEQFLERNFAAVTDRVRDTLGALARKHPEKFFYADSRGFAKEYRDIIVKCNNLELITAMEPLANAEDFQTILRNGEALCKVNGKAAVVTLGEEGACVFENAGVTKLTAFQVEGPLDIVGAGDATSAGTILGLTLGLDLPSAALLGGCVSSITIQQIGVTGTATVAQVRERLMAALG